MDFRLASRAGALLHHYGGPRSAWRAAAWSLLFSGLGQWAGGQRSRGLGWAALAGGLFSAAVWIESMDLLFLALFAGLLAGPLLILAPLALVGAAPPLWAPVFWFGALAKLACVADAWFIGRNRSLPLSSVRRIWPVFAALQVLPALCFCQAFFVFSLPGSPPAEFCQPGDVVLGIRQGAWVPWGGRGGPAHGDLVGLVTGSGPLVMRVVGLPGETVLVEVDEKGHISYRTDRAALAPERTRLDEFCVWVKADGGHLRCTFHEERRGPRGRPYRIATLGAGPDHEYRELAFPLEPGELFLLSDLRHVVLQPAWLRVRASDVAGTPLVILWSRHPTRGIAWHRISRTGG
jgi:hypothetical protein